MESISKNIVFLTDNWKDRLLPLSNEIIISRRNAQNRNIKQILGHLIDSASNNHQRIVRMQYTSDKTLAFPDYTNENDLWIAIQQYEFEDWNNLVQLFLFYNLHIAHVINNIDKEKLDRVWTDSEGNIITLQFMTEIYLDHLRLHLNEIDQLINQT